jgi:hypothetical protein
MAARSGAAQTVARSDDSLPATRSFRMGFSGWPSDLTVDGLRTATEFAYGHGDLVSVTFNGGIPWPEALAGRPFSANLQANLAYQPRPGTKLFLAVSPLNSDCSGLAPYYGERNNLPLPPPWRSLRLNSPQVKAAFLAFVLRAVNAMHPDYLAIGVDDNMVLLRDASQWAQLKDLHRATYLGVKARYPNLPVCFTTEVVRYKKLVDEARRTDQIGGVRDLMRFSDLFAMSVYPYLSSTSQGATPDNFFDFARTFHKPIAVSDCGMTSRSVFVPSLNLAMHGSPKDQAQFIRLLLSRASRDRYVFVVNFATTDFERMFANRPQPVDERLRAMAYTGMQTSDRTAKPALAVWDAYLKLPYAAH